MDAREQLVMSHMNLVRFLANKFKNRGEPLDDLMQVGYLGLLKAIDRFDPDRGLEFTTYATPTILGEIKRHFRDKVGAFACEAPAGAFRQGEPGDRHAHHPVAALPLSRGDRDYLDARWTSARGHGILERL
mgnify:CR=1 FL=1